MSKKLILLVEDELILGMTGKMTLEKYGYEVLIAINGEKAVAAFSERTAIDLVLMDIDLGKGIDGTETARLILQLRDIPVVFLSSHTEPEVVEKTEKITSYGYVVKNSGITVLDASIKMAFKLFEANRLIAESEGKQRAMLANISDVIAIIGEHGIIKYSSPNLQKWFGWEQDELMGTYSWLTVHPDDYDRLRKAILGILESDRASITTEFSFKCKDGSYTPVELTAINLWSDPSIEGILLNYHDISERKRAEEALQKKMEELQKFQKFTVGRELMMVELKKETNALLVKCGQSEKYRIVK